MLIQGWGCGARGAVLVGIVLVVGCSSTVVLPDGTEVPAEVYMAQQSMADKQRARADSMSGFQECDASEMAQDEYSECTNFNQLYLMAMVLRPEQGGVDAGYWNLVNAREQRRDPLRYVNAATQLTQSLCLLGIVPCGGAGSGGNSFDITASDQGTVSVEGLSSGNQSPIIQGDDNLVGTEGSGIATDEGVAAASEGQALEGDGLQGRVFTDPPNQPGITFGDGATGGEGDGSPGGAGGGSIGNESSTGIQSDI